MFTLLVFTLSLGAEPTPLFNGKDLSNWIITGDTNVWKVEDGVIVCEGGGGGWLLSKKEYADFTLNCDYRWLKPGTNSGIALRTPKEGNPAYAGMEIQLIDDDGWEDVHKFKLAPYQHTGSIYDVQPAKATKNKPIGEWNKITITCNGPKVTIEVNGETIVDTKLTNYPKKMETHPGLKRDSGHVGVQSYNTRVEFRNITIEELK